MTGLASSGGARDAFGDLGPVERSTAEELGYLREGPVPEHVVDVVGADRSQGGSLGANGPGHAAEVCYRGAHRSRVASGDGARPLPW